MALKIAAKGVDPPFFQTDRQMQSWFKARRRRCLCNAVTSRRVRRKLKPGEGFHKQLGVSAGGAFTHTRPNTGTHSGNRGNVTSNELCRSAAYQYASPSPTETFFLFVPPSVSTCYLLSAPCPSVSHPNASSSQSQKTKQKVF